MFAKGQTVRNPGQPQWGLGTVLEMNSADRAKVRFEDGNVRLLSLTVVTLELVQGVRVSRQAASRAFLEPLPSPDMSKLRAACGQFISLMENRRSNADDAGVARLIIKEMVQHGRLTLTTYKRLASWCHTDASFREGVDLAHDISRIIFGRIISKDDIG